MVLVVAAFFVQLLLEFLLLFVVFLANVFILDAGDMVDYVGLLGEQIVLAERKSCFDVPEERLEVLRVLLLEVVELLLHHLLPSEVQLHHFVLVETRDQDADDLADALAVEGHVVEGLGLHFVLHLVEELVELLEEFR